MGDVIRSLGRVLPALLVCLGVIGCDGSQQETDKALIAPETQPEFYGTLEPFAEQAVYFVLTDRFVDGDPGNNHVEQGGENSTFDRPIQGAGGVEANIGYLGGDFRGILDHAGYIRDMGFTALWITPVVDNPDEAFTGGEGGPDLGKTGYHGYWGVNFYRIDEHLPSAGLDFREFASRLRENGLKLVLDIVGNHGSPSFSMPEDQPGFGELYDADGKLVADHQNLRPEQLDHDNPLQQWFHREKDIGELSNLNERNPQLVDYLINSYLYWIEQGAAAVRIDTIKHMPHSFWKQVSDRIRARYPGYFMFAESFNFNAAEIAAHTQPENGGISVLDFPGRQAMVKVFENPQSDFSELLGYLHLDDGVYNNPYELMTFYDNHDMARINASDQGFIDANNWLFTSRGIPVVYYGSEIGFMRGASEHQGNRNYFGVENIRRAENHPIREALKSIANIRQASIALQKGLQINLRFAGQTASFLRVYQKDGVSQTALVMLNKGDSPAVITADRMLNLGAWREAVTGEHITVSERQPVIEAELAPHSVSVWLYDQPVNSAELMARLVVRGNPG